MKFNAFISYSHAADGKIGPALQKALVRLAKPWYRLRALRLFRDETSLSASPHLWTNIEEGLRESEYFILLASPVAAASKWVQKEISFWMANKPVDNIIICLTDGEIIWDDEAGDFSWQLTNALPAILKGVFKMEPLYVDFRSSRTSDDLSLHNPEFKKKLIYVAATLHKKLVEDLVSEDIEQHKRTLRIRNSAIAILISLLLISLATSWMALHQSNIAKIQRDIARKQTAIAIQERNTALSRFYFAMALQKREQQYDSAIFYAIKAYQANPTTETKRGFYELINFKRNIVAYLHHNNDQFIKTFAGKNNEIASAGRKGTIDLISIKGAAANVTKSIDLHLTDEGVNGEPNTVIDIDPALETVAFSSKNNIIFWDLVKNKQIAEPLTGHTNEVTSLAFSHSGKILAAGDWDGKVILWDVATHEKLFQPFGGNTKNSGDPMARGIMYLTFSPNDSLLVTTGGDNNVILWQVANGQQYGHAMKKHAVTFNQVFSGITAAAFTHDGKYLATGGNDRKIIIWDVKKQESIGRDLEGHNAPVTALFFDDEKNILISGSESGEIKFWNLGTLAAFVELNNVHSGKVTSIIRNAGGDGYISAGEDGKSILLDPFPASDRVAEKYQHAMPGAQPTSRGSNGLSLYPDILRKTELSGSGELLASGSDDGVLVVWNTKANKEILRKKLFSEKVFSIEFDHTERYMAAGGYSENLFLYDLKSGDQWELQSGGMAIGSICFNNGADEVAAGTSGGLCYLWDLHTKKIKTVFQSENRPISLIAFINDDRQLLVCNTDGLIKIVNTGDQKMISTLQLKMNANDITINHSKNIIAVRQENHVELLKIAGDQLSSLTTIPLPATNEYGNGLFVNNAGTVLAAVTGNAVCIYDIKTGKQLLPMLSGSTSINSISLDNSGQKLAADVSGNVQVWDLDFESWIEKGWKITGFKRQ